MIRVTESNDVSGRKGVSWETVWLQLPDDGTGALPLLRHVVFNDQKSSTYKLALLRALLRIADGAAGFARPGANDDHVELPLGLVALYWIRSFQPLIKADLPQQPRGNLHLGFVKEGFRGLMDRSPFDLRVWPALQRKGRPKSDSGDSRGGELRSTYASQTHYIPGEQQAHFSRWQTRSATQEVGKREAGKH